MKAKHGFCRHECAVLPFYRQLFLICSSVIYCVDIFTDFYVAIETLFVRQGQTTLGILMMIFVVLPLVYSNYIAQSNRVGRVRYKKRGESESIYWIDSRVVNGRVFKRTLFPYSWENPYHVVFNCLCLLQLGILIDVVEMLCHNRQNISQISWQYYHYTYIRRLEVG